MNTPTQFWLKKHKSKGEIPDNGLAESGAIIRLGRRVLIDESEFLA